MKICCLVVRRVPPVPSPILREVYEILARQGFQIETGIAEETMTRPDCLQVAHDLYILKSHTELSLSLAGILHAQGARLLNPYPCCAATQNKILASRRLRAVGAPIPCSWVTENLALLGPIVAERPLIIKPYQGHRGAGIHIVRNPDELAAVPPPTMPVLVQEYIQGTGEDLKVYVAGENVFGVRKSFSPSSFACPGRPAPISDEVREIALRCGQVFGLGLYGLDVIESRDGPYVVDLNYFPGYKGVPNVAPLIAAYIEGYARGRYELQLPAMPRTEEQAEGVEHLFSSAVAMPAEPKDHRWPEPLSCL